MATPRSLPNFLSGPYLDRAAQLRKDEAWINAALDDPQTRFVAMWRSRHLVARAAAGFNVHFLGRQELPTNLDITETILLGEYGGKPCFAVELTAQETPALGTAEFEDLRMLASELPREQAGLLSYARAMLLWRERHRYCGRCSSLLVPKQAGHMLLCSNPECGIHQFPRIDPAIIVLVTDGDRALLGRQAAWPPGRYSTIAGFVEPGESLEDAVAREVREETGVIVDTVDYHSSQPWPFPSSLMLGFLAHAVTEAIELIDAELEDARWVSREQIAAGEVLLPFSHSISFRLIEEWYDSDAAIPLQETSAARVAPAWPRPK